ncbi:putative FlgD protein [Parvularcula bermudensis HTCC2503]|uniref:Basal-body rod modification protein FlgD n=1 Tax=Parvularcula bermudensis (strain ATCC BAA-594 / HTCC2503 / KCTC 12087) TaxID=314260 RepID=E0TH54_PARBH|nr:flagellar hook capping FlgD N-terminal domain-containing protein [Parvularcula bermudensis]ADM09638.1 putative FlgD protein [Parvularcula bermudensis HTCC2503]
MEISPTSAQSAASAANQKATQSLATDLDAFLNLLTAQMKNQDPFAPIDSTQFVEQLATFSSLEQQVQTNKYLETMMGLLQSTLGGQQTDVIGAQIGASEITISGAFDPLPIVSGSDAEGALVVRNAQGDVVFRGPRADEWSWNGQTNEGTLAAPGTYSFEIETDSTVLDARALGTVDRVITDTNGQVVGIGPTITTDTYKVI